MLTKAQVETYARDGFIIIPKIISSDKLQAMRDELDKWIEESKSYKENYGETPNGKARFDLERGHCAENPKLRRVANPADISQAY